MSAGKTLHTENFVLAQTLKNWSEH